MWRVFPSAQRMNTANSPPGEGKIERIKRDSLEVFCRPTQRQGCG